MLAHESNDSWCKEKDHPDDDQDRNDTPGEIDDFLRTLIKQKAHSSVSCIIPAWKSAANYQLLTTSYALFMMWTRNQRGVAVRLFLKRLGLLILLLLVAYAASGVWGVYKKERETAARRAEAERELSELDAREKKLQTDIDRLQSDRGLEEALRAQYGMAERGEGLIVIVDPPTAEPIVATSSANWFRKMFWWF